MDKIYNLITSTVSVPQWWKAIGVWITFQAPSAKCLENGHYHHCHYSSLTEDFLELFPHEVSLLPLKGGANWVMGPLSDKSHGKGRIVASTTSIFLTLVLTSIQVHVGIRIYTMLPSRKPFGGKKKYILHHLCWRWKGPRSCDGRSRHRPSSDQLCKWLLRGTSHPPCQPVSTSFPLWPYISSWDVVYSQLSNATIYNFLGSQAIYIYCFGMEGP